MKPPVFVVGCPRSGTTLLYSMLIAAGGFAVYRKETYFYDLAPRFPDLSVPRVQADFKERYLAGYLGRVAGLDVRRFLETALQQCDGTASVLPLMMDGITRAQGMDRWIEATPSHVLWMDTIAAAVPAARFIHVVRDGRDCALSHVAQGWVPTLPWHRDRQTEVAALYWEWMVAAGRRYCAAHPDSCLEVRFEDLVADSTSTLARVGKFIDQDLSYEQLLAHPVHALRAPNTSFRAERRAGTFNPVARWKSHSDAEETARCEALIGRQLHELGYKTDGGSHQERRPWRVRMMRWTYLSFFAFKQWLKARTPLGRFLTSTRVWTEQPREGEKLIAPIPSATGVLTPGHARIQ